MLILIHAFGSTFAFLLHMALVATGALSATAIFLGIALLAAFVLISSVFSTFSHA